MHGIDPYTPDIERFECPDCGERTAQRGECPECSTTLLNIAVPRE